MRKELTPVSISRRLVATVVLTAAFAFPIGVLASHEFTDVPTSSTFHDDISAIADAGVTTGCAAGKYCPKDFVTREQMAAFLNRLGALAPGKTPVVNATKLDGKDSTAFLETADIITTHSGVWTVPASDADDVTIHPNVDATRITSPAASSPLANLNIDAPASIGNRTFALESISVCFKAASGSPIVTGLEVKQLLPTGPEWLITNPNDYQMTSPGCIFATDATPAAIEGGVRLEVALSFPGSGAVNFTSVTATWTPVS
jgi:hypothetical protein